MKKHFRLVLLFWAEVEHWIQQVYWYIKHPLSPLVNVHASIASRKHVEIEMMNNLKKNTHFWPEKFWRFDTFIKSKFQIQLKRNDFLFL